jgi:hypothetical protein
MLLHLFGRLVLNRDADQRYTPEEVRDRLRRGSDPDLDARTLAVHAAAADVGAWTALMASQVAHDLGRAAERLPSIVFWFVQGRGLDEMGRMLSPLGSTWDADQAIEVASGLIARLLNQRGAAYAPGSAENRRSA